MLRNESFDTKDEIIQNLKNVAPSIFSEGKVDMEKLKALLGEEVESGKEKFRLSWMGKSEAIKSINIPSKGTLRPNTKKSLTNGVEKENSIIEGDNLEVLKLLQKSYYGKVKMIYIDPPYNREEDFIYNDDFSQTLDAYLKYTDQVDNEGQAVSSEQEKEGRKHSNWLSLMYPRLFLARNLLKKDGVIFISIDDKERKNLEFIMDEIFGEENKLGVIVWKKKTNGNNMGYIPPVHDYILCYAKNASEDCLLGFPLSKEYVNKNYANPDNDPQGEWKTSDLSANHEGPYFPITNPNNGEVHYPPRGRYWVFNEEEVKKRIKDGRIIFGKSGKASPVQKVYLKDRKSLRKKAESWWDKHGMNEDGTAELSELIGTKVFDHPKPTTLIKHLCEIATKENDLILDFFAGSGTTAHSVLDLNKKDNGKRKFILVQLPEPIAHDKFQNIAELTRERIIQAAKQIDVNPNFKYFNLDSSNFRDWNYDLQSEEDVRRQMELWKDPFKEGRTEEDLLYEVLLKAGFTLTADIKKHEVRKSFFYEVIENDQHILIYLGEELSESLINVMREIYANQVFFLDEAFDSDDQKKNIQLQWEEEGVAFRSI
ncbi:adenine-specific DNA-methyltransferase [Halobacillus dabanensis]|uniref:Adenine-specific DNA-methyltransferase n=1 Tax=Halobacillus dabanensis TaxID=240302 RepID=A0A1I3ZXU1_HALDA|nr:site-specific DNA-methyltransferase [Halobacillus dabanensis]SFK48954.1 adenine-specific DNA-methyltransferase [Halobacillus dabanensis]